MPNNNPNQNQWNLTLNGPVGPGTVYGPTVVGSGVPASSIVPLNAPISAAASMINQITTKLAGGSGSKYIVEYIIVPHEGPCLELFEESRITPREMIGICKFLGLVQVAITAASHGLVMDWSELIQELGIERHFSPGLPSPDDYKQDEEILYIFLYDPAP